MKIIKFKKYTTEFELNLIDDIFLEESEIEKIINNFEIIFSRFLKSSELSKINEKGGDVLSNLFLKLFKLNIDLNKLSKGFFNPFIDIENIGYSDKKIKKKKLEKINFSENYELNGNKLILKNNIKLDFGGSAKGFLVDLLSDYLKKKGAKNFFINFGGDIFISGNKNLEKWAIGINNPFENGKNIGIILLENKSISSSGNYKRNWEINGKKYHHILNPKNNKNENEIVMVSIIGENTYFTDAIATSVFNMGIDFGLNFLNENNIDGIIVGNNKKYYLTKNFKQKYEIQIYKF